MKIADRQIRTVHEHRIEDSAALGEVLDVLVSAVLTRGSGTSRLAGHACVLVTGQGSQYCIAGLGRKCKRGNPIGIGGNEGALAGIPLGEQGCRRSRAHESRVDDARERDVRNVTRRRRLAGEIPDGFVRIGELFGEEAAAVVPREDARVPPALAGQRTRIFLGDRPDIQDVDDQEVAGLRAFDGKGAGQRVDRGQWCIENVVG